MVFEVLACKLNLPYLSLSSPKITSLLYDPNSLSLALMHSDSTISLYPSFCPFSVSSPSLPNPQTLIPPPTSSACFVSLNPNPNPKDPDCPENTHVVFVNAGPYNGGSRVVLRFYLLGKDGKFGKTQVGCCQNGISFSDLGVIVDLSHGMKVLLVGSVNYFAMYSASAGKIWVFGLKLDGAKMCLRLVKCAVIDCPMPVSSICISFGFLIVGEVHGVRIFPLRALVKGGIGNRRQSRKMRRNIESLNGEQHEVNVKLEGLNLKMPNGVLKPFGESYELDKNLVIVNSSKSNKPIANGHGYNVLHGCSSNSNVAGNQNVKPRSIKVRQDSGEVGMQFVLFNDSIIEGTESSVPQHKRTKAISIQALSQQKFLILDSNGDLHVLHVSKSGSSKLRRLTGIIQVHQSAAFPDKSTNTQTIWLSDGHNSVHKLVMPCTDNAENDHDMSINERRVIQSSVTEAIFASESIQDMIPLAANTVLLLGQDSLFAYAIS